MGTTNGESEKESPQHEFRTTRWSLVCSAGEGESEEKAAAIEQLCEAYWFPIYAFVRRKTGDAECAQDLTQSFFQNLLERDVFSIADPEKGRLRSFLLTACKNFLSKARQAEMAIKRGGGVRHIGMDFVDAESKILQIESDEKTPEEIFDRQWGMILLQNVMQRLEDDYAQSGKDQLFQLLKGCLTGDQGHSYSRIAEEAGLSESAVKMQVHRMRQKFRKFLRLEMAQIVQTPEQVDQEIEYLFATMVS